MDALDMAAADAASTGHSTPAASGMDESPRPMRPRIVAALAVLQEGFRYAQELKVSRWEFATEIAALRPLGLTNADLRWLVARGLIEHGLEVTLESDSQRSFQRPGQLMFSKRTCLVLSPAGAELAAGVVPVPDDVVVRQPCRPTDQPTLAIASSPGVELPKWDRNRHELRLGSTLVRRFQIPSDNEETVLAAFEESNWPARIDDPLPSADERSPQRLQQTIEALNRKQKQSLIRFRQDETGCGVQWELCGEADLPAEA